MFLAAGHLSAQGLTVSGILDSTVSLRAGAGDAPDFSWGLEEYANIRMQAKIRDSIVFHGAANFIAAAEDSAAAAGLAAGESYIAGAEFNHFYFGAELERLYFRLNGETVSLDAGLFRLPFGYGNVWGPSDFLNPKNPLKPDARPRAVLGAGFFWYPDDPWLASESSKLLIFGAAPRSLFLETGDGGGFMGLSADQHWDRASLQLLYSFELPHSGAEQGIHRTGMSVKADLELGLVMDILYTYNTGAGTGLDGLSFSAGFDYSFFEGNLIVLAEYLYNGAASSTAFDMEKNISGRLNKNYLYTGFTWRFNDYTNTGIALLSGFDDLSFTPIISLNHDLSQKIHLNITMQVPLDRDLLFGDGNRGELGPLPPGYTAGSYFNCSARIRIRF